MHLLDTDPYPWPYDADLRGDRLAMLVLGAQHGWAAVSSDVAGVRGALHTAIETIPEPFGGDADAWNTWVDQVTKRVRAITKVAIALFDDGPGEEPWLNLATPVEVDQAA